jgi:hypothetical protein
VEAFLAELDRRLNELRCLPPPTKRRITEWSRAQTDQELIRGYLDHFLASVELLISEAGPAFHRLCDELIEEESEWFVLSRFGYRGANYAEGWAEVELQQPSPVEQLYCTVNTLAFVLPTDSADLAEQISATMFLQFFHRVKGNRVAEAINWAENELKITAASYSDPKALYESISPLLQQRLIGQSLRFLSLMALGLIDLRRVSDAANLFTAVFWSETEGSATATTIGNRLRRLRDWAEEAFPSQPASDLASELVANYPAFREAWRRAIAYGFGFFVEKMTDIDLRMGQPQKALAAVAALLGLWPEPGTSLIVPFEFRQLVTDELYRKLLFSWALSLNACERVAEAGEAIRSQITSRDQDGRPAIWSQPESAAAAAILEILATTVGEVHGNAAALELLCVTLGLSADDFGDTNRLREIFSERFMYLSGPTLLRLVGVLQVQLWGTGHALESVAAMEVALGLELSAYQSSDTVRERLRPYWSGDVPGEGELKSLLHLSILLGLNGRGRHALRLLFAINPQLCRNWDVDSYEQLRAWLADFSSSLIDDFISQLGLLLASSPETATGLFLTHLGLNSDAFSDRVQLAASLHQRRRKMSILAWVNGTSGLMATMMDLAIRLPNPRSILPSIIVLGESAMNIGPEWYLPGAVLSTPEKWPESRLQWRLATIELSTPLSWALLEAGRPEDAIVLIDSVMSSLIGATHRDPCFLRILVSNEYPGWEIASLIALVSPLLRALERGGKNDELFSLAHGLAENPHWFQPGRRGNTQMNWVVMDTLLPVLAQSHLSVAIQLVRTFVPAFREFGLREDVIGIDRIRLIQLTQDVRHHLIQTGYEAVAADPDGGSALRLETLCWDVELGQLMLRERFDRQATRPEIKTQPLPAGLPFTPDRERRPFAAAAFALRAVAATPISVPTIRLDGPSVSGEAHGILPEMLASKLGRDEMLLRIGFTADGRLIWTLFASSDDRERLNIVADERTAGPAAADVRSRLVEAVREHDQAITAAWAAYNARTQSIAQELAHAGKRYSPPMAEKHRQEMQTVLLQITEEHRTGLDSRTNEFLKAVSKALQLDALADALTEHDDLVVQVDDILHAVPLAFVTVDRRYLFERVRSVRVSLSLSVDDELSHLDSRQANPDWFARSSDQPDPTELAARVIGLSWFDPDANELPARLCARRFHQDLAAVTVTCGGLEYRAAGENPSGSHSALAADLAVGGPVRILAMLGHGDQQLAGVKLADGFWTGAELLRAPPNESLTGCDLSEVEFLIQVSCTVGRVLQTGTRDVEGFCANLVVGRVRSAVAGLWDLFADDAITFAISLAQHYLQTRIQLDEDRVRWGFASFDIQRPRARSLAAARRAWLSANRERVPRFLNTVAAFELYGRG